jgi:type IV secretory pathway VirB2 component (pilin)
MIIFLALEVLSFGLTAFAKQNSQSLDNINESQINVDNRVGTNAAGATVRNDNTVDYFLCFIIVVLTGKIARVILALSIFVMGIMFFLGKVNWTLFVVTAIGVGITLGASKIVIAILPRATQIVEMDENGNKIIVTKTTYQMIAERCPEIV